MSPTSSGTYSDIKVTLGYQTGHDYTQDVITTAAFNASVYAGQVIPCVTVTAAINGTWMTLPTVKSVDDITFYIPKRTNAMSKDYHVQFVVSDGGALKLQEIPFAGQMTYTETAVSAT